MANPVSKGFLDLARSAGSALSRAICPFDFYA